MRYYRTYSTLVTKAALTVKADLKDKAIIFKAVLDSKVILSI